MFINVYCCKGLKSISYLVKKCIAGGVQSNDNRESSHIEQLKLKL